MLRKQSLILLLAIMISSCVPPAVDQPTSDTQEVEKTTNPFFLGFNQTIPFADLGEGDITDASERALREAELTLKGIIGIDPEQRTFENTMLDLDNLTAIVSRVWNPAFLMGSVHTDERIRSEADSSHVRFSRFINELSANEELYNAVLTFSESDEAENLEGERRKYLEETFLGFRRSGFGLGKREAGKGKRDQQ